MPSTEKPLITPDKPTVRSTSYELRLRLWRCFAADSLYMEAFVKRCHRGQGLELLGDLLELSEADCKQAMTEISQNMRAK